MVGRNEVELNIQHEYPKLHPVFNVALVVRYYSPNSLIGRGTTDQGIKQKYYDENKILDCAQLKAVLDVKQLTKYNRQFLLTWKNTTVGEYIGVSEEQIPASLQSSVKNYARTHKENKEGKLTKRRKRI